MNFIYNILKFLLRDFLHPEEMAGDICEVHEYTIEKEGKVTAYLLLFRQIMGLSAKYIKNSLFGGVHMFSSYFKTGIRQLKKEKLQSAINVFGLAIGLISAMLVTVFIHYELSYDKFHNDSERIVRIITQSKNESSMDERTALTMAQLKEAIEQVEGVKYSTHLFRYTKAELESGDKKFTDLTSFYTDHDFFEVFDFKVLHGEKKEFLKTPESLVLSESIARTLFGTTSVLGEVLKIGKSTFKIDGVVEDAPGNSHFSYDFFISKKNIEWIFQQRSNEVYTYFSVKEGFDVKSVTDDVKPVCDLLYKPREERGYKAVVAFQMLEDIHLYSSDLGYKIGIHGNINNIYILSIFPFALLIIVSINFINLLTARSQGRLKETGLRKVIGANRSSLIVQFLSESTVIAVSAAVIGVVVFYLILDSFALITGKDLSVYYGWWPLITGGFLTIALVTGVLSAIYPGIKVSKETATSLLNNSRSVKKKNSLMRGTVIVQFVIVIVLITSVKVINSQYSFAKNIDPGFNREEVFYFSISSIKNFDLLKENLLQHSGVLSVAGSQSVPGERRSGQILKEFDSRTLEKKVEIYENRVRYGFVDTYQIEILAGRGFNENSFNSGGREVVINEELLSYLGVSAEEAIGREIVYNRKAKIVGVMKNYHYFSLHEKIEPMLLSSYTKSTYTMSVRFKSEQIRDVLKHTENVLKGVEKASTFKYDYLDEKFAQMYETEEKNHQVVFYATITSIILSVAGLFALTLFTVIQKTKEIGVRKVMGASAWQVNFLLLKGFLQWVVVANVIAVPLAYYVMSKWLESFAYKIELNPWYFVFAGFTSLIIAAGTIIYHTTKAASMNPVDSIKYE